MRVVNIHQAKTHLSRLVREVAEGEPFIIARAGKPLAKVIAIDSPGSLKSRIGFIKGEMAIPDDFDRMAAEEIEKLFCGDE